MTTVVDNPLSGRRQMLKQQDSTKNIHSFASPLSGKTAPETPSSTSSRRSSRLLSSVSSKSKRASLAKKMVKALSAPPLPMDDEKDKLKSLQKSPRVFIRDLLPRQESEKTLSSLEIDTAVMMAMDKYAFMSYQFPMTQKTEKIVFRKFGPNDAYACNEGDILIETTGGEIIGSVDYSYATDRGIRIIQDAGGKPCAIIKRKQDESILGGPSSIFQVYGTKPSTNNHNPSNDQYTNGCYLWAEIKNSKAMGGGKFVMNTKQGSSYSTRRFGGLFSKERSSGFNFFDKDEKEIVKMISLKDKGNKGIVLAPNCDMCLMLAFCVVVDEMVENILI